MDETTDELMEATYVALCEHGYAALRMKDIAEETSKSKATLHYHYDTKVELLYAFLEYLYERFERRVDEIDGETATERLVALVDLFLTPRREETGEEFQTAILEIKAQGPYDERFREQLRQFDRLLLDRFEVIVEDGQESGEFDADVDPAPMAEFVVTLLNGAQTRTVAVGRPTGRTGEEFAEYVVDLLRAEVPEEVSSP